MKRFCIGLSLVLVTAFAGTATAGTDFLIDWGDEGKVDAASYTLATHNHGLGDLFTLHGVTSEALQADPFNGVLDFLETGVNGNEYTFELTATSLGTIDLGGIFYTVYGPGVFSVYEDAAANWDFANPSTFTDGTLMIEGTTNGMTTTINDFLPCPPGVFGDWHTDLVYGQGGTLGSLVAGCVGTIDATYTDSPCNGNVTIPAGYTHHSNGNFSIEDNCGGATATEESSWSGVKGLFR